MILALGQVFLTDSNKLKVPSALVSKSLLGSLIEVVTAVCAPKCKMPSKDSELRHFVRSSDFDKSPRWIVVKFSKSGRYPFSKLSNIWMFLYPLSFKIRAQLNPMNPAPPVISIFIKLDKVWMLYASSDLFLSK